MDTSVTIAGIGLKNPIILASGPMSNSKAALLKAGEMGVGGIVTKSSTLAPCAGNPHPHTVLGKSYVINADGICNQGYVATAAGIAEARRGGLGVPVIASVAGASVDGFVEMGQEFQRQGADGVELNFVCPNRGLLVGAAQEETLGRYWAENVEKGRAVVSAVKGALKVPVWVKMPFDAIYREPALVRKVEAAGADAIVVMTTMPRAMAINLETGRPVLGNPRGAGAVGGRMMKPLGINCVAEVSRMVTIPVIATGGVFSGQDIVEYGMVGAWAVEVLSAFMLRVSVSDMLRELEETMTRHGYDTPGSFRGKTLSFLAPLPGA